MGLASCHVTQRNNCDDRVLVPNTGKKANRPIGHISLARRHIFNDRSGFLPPAAEFVAAAEGAGAADAIAAPPPDQRSTRLRRESSTVVYSGHERTPKVQTATACLDTLNPEQRRAVEHGAAGGLAAPPLLVIAGAGSGKTNTLAHRVAHLIVQGADPRRILLMTFSRRAASEMTKRIGRIAANGSRVNRRVSSIGRPSNGFRSCSRPMPAVARSNISKAARYSRASSMTTRAISWARAFPARMVFVIVFMSVRHCYGGGRPRRDRSAVFLRQRSKTPSLPASSRIKDRMDPQSAPLRCLSGPSLPAITYS